MKAGFIGLGGMGRPIARNILRAGFDLVVTDVREEPVRELVAEGAGAVRSAAEAAAADIVLASLPTNEASVEVGAEVVSAAKPGTVYADLSTITPAVIRRLADQGERRGVEVLDAPVSGGMQQREEGTLAVMVGGTLRVSGQPGRRRWSRRPAVDESVPAGRGPPSRAGSSRSARVFPSSTPHWSKELTPHTTPSTNTRCS